MELNINQKNLYPIKDGGFCKTLSNNKKHEKIARHVVKFMRGHFERCVNPTVVKDFGSGICVKFKFGKMSEESKPELEKYLKEVESMNVWKVFDKAMYEAVQSMRGKEPVDVKVIKDLKERATVWFKKELNEWDKKLGMEVNRAIMIGHESKCKKKPGVYNFTGLVLSHDVFEVLNMGKNAIPDYKIPFRVRRTKFREAC